MDLFGYRLDILKSLNEDQFREKILIPYFREMGYENVRLNHGSEEIGKDIIMSKIENNIRINYAIVAKAKKISGSAERELAGIYVQINQALGTQYRDLTSKILFPIDKVILANNYPIKPSLFKKILASHTSWFDKIEYLDGTAILENMEKHNITLSIFDAVSKGLDQIKNKYKLNKLSITKSNNSTFIELEPSFDTPQELLKGRFTLNKTGINKLKRFHETGQKSIIDSEDIIEFIQPEIYSKIKPNDRKVGIKEFVIGPRTRTNNYKLNVFKNMFDISDFIDLKIRNYGTSQISFYHETPFIDIEFEINKPGKDSAFRFQIKQIKEVNSYILYKYERLLHNIYLSHHLEFLDESSGVSSDININKMNEDKFPSIERITLLEKIYLIQKFFKKDIIVPLREFTKDEIDTIFEVYQIITVGTYELRPGTFNFDIELRNREAKDRLKTGIFDDIFSIEIDQNAELFSTLLDLGVSKIFIQSGYIKCEPYNKNGKEYSHIELKYDKKSKPQVIFEEFQKS